MGENMNDAVWESGKFLVYGNKMRPKGWHLKVELYSMVADALAQRSIKQRRLHIGYAS